MKAVTVAALLASMAVATIAQAEVYKWQDELCDIQGNFDNKKYTAKQIENAHFMLNNLTSVQLNSTSSPMNLKDIDKVTTADLDNLDQEYKLRKRKVESLKVVIEAQPYKRELLKSIDGEYFHDKLSILAYLAPVQAMRQSPPICKQYLAPFFKGEAAVQRKWQQFVEEQIQEQERISSDRGQSYRTLRTERYQEERASDPANYAKISLLTFGFSNCLNDHIYHADSQKVFSNQQKLNKILFGKSLTMVCEEP